MANGNGNGGFRFYAGIIAIVLAVNGGTVGVLLPQIAAGRSEVRDLRAEVRELKDNHMAHLDDAVVAVRLDVRGLIVEVKAMCAALDQHIKTHR